MEREERERVGDVGGEREAEVSEERSERRGDQVE